MSMIGMFGVCPQSHYNKLANLLKSKDSGETEKLMQKIYIEVEASAEKLANDQCSGEVFTALFYYLKTAYGIDLQRGKEAFREKWTAVSGDWDAVVFHEKEQLLSLEDSMDFGGASLNLAYVLIPIQKQARAAKQVPLGPIPSMR